MDTFPYFLITELTLSFVICRRNFDSTVCRQSVIIYVI